MNTMGTKTCLLMIHCIKSTKMPNDNLYNYGLGLTSTILRALNSSYFLSTPRVSKNKLTGCI